MGDPDAHVGCAQAQLHPARVPAVRHATGGGASQNRSTGGRAPTGVPTPTSGARMRNCVMYACLRHAPRPEVARAKTARPEVEHQPGSRSPRRVRECATASRTRACGTPRDRRWREPKPRDRRSRTNARPEVTQPRIRATRGHTPCATEGHAPFETGGHAPMRDRSLHSRAQFFFARRLTDDREKQCG